jgi:16S rRNA (guanine527-N7)-methyltransferase
VQVGQLAEQLLPFQLVMTEEIKQRIERFCSQLVVWNERYALISRQDVEYVLRKHVAASLGPLLLLAPNPLEHWVDVGSGAGFPGMILKLWSPEQRITLIDGSRKKCLFLEQISRDLQLSPVPILQVRVETMVARGDAMEAFDVLFARAVADLGTTLREFGPLVRANGTIISFKGPTWRDDVRFAQEQGHLSPERFVLEEVLQVPWAPGHLLRLRKTS